MSLSSLFKSVSKFLNTLPELKESNKDSERKIFPDSSEVKTDNNNFGKNQNTTSQEEQKRTEHDNVVKNASETQKTVNRTEHNYDPSDVTKESALSEIGTNSKDAPQNTAMDVSNEALMEKPVETTPDVYLDVPSLKVQELKLNVEDLNARVALNAELAGLIKINVGVNAGIKKLDLDLKGVDLKAVLKVRLKQVYAIFDRALDTIDKSPGILKNQELPQSENVQKLQNEINDNISNEVKEGESPVETHHSLTNDEQRYRFRVDSD